MFIIYDIIFLIFAIAYVPYLIFKRKWHNGLWTRLGLSLPPKLADKKIIWVHAVSVGEVLVVLNLIQKIQERFSEYAVVLSTVTPTGHALAIAKLQGKCPVIYAPLDFSWIVRKYVNMIDPVLYVSAETEIWPNLFTYLHKRGIPIVEVNGRISDKAFPGYRKVSFLVRRILRDVRLFCMQTSEDARRVIELGADSERVRIVGNLKFDNLLREISVKKEDLGFREQDRLFIAGSTYPGEEAIILEVYNNLKMQFPFLRLVIAPRHVKRANEIARLCEYAGLLPQKFSSNPVTLMADASTVLVIDRIGYLRDLYGLADVVFVGKSLRGMGGQNMLEPLALGKPTLVGPRTENFRDIVNIFTPTGALLEVNTPQEMIAQLRNLLYDPQRCERIGLEAQKEVARHQGATEATMRAIEEILVL